MGDCNRPSLSKHLRLQWSSYSDAWLITLPVRPTTSDQRPGTESLPLTCSLAISLLDSKSVIVRDTLRHLPAEKGGRRDSNPQQPEPQSGALPLSYGHRKGSNLGFRLRIATNSGFPSSSSSSSFSSSIGIRFRARERAVKGGAIPADNLSHFLDSRTRTRTRTMYNN